jgi:hypothetical protein
VALLISKLISVCTFFGTELACGDNGLSLLQKELYEHLIVQPHSPDSFALGIDNDWDNADDSRLGTVMETSRICCAFPQLCK